MNFSLTPEMEEMVNEKVKSGKYRTAAEVIGAALELLKEQGQAEERLEMLLEAADQSGDGIELTSEARQRIEEEALDTLRTRQSA